MFVYLVTFCIVSVLFRFCFFFDNFFALLHVLTNQSRYEYVSLYWVHSASKPKWTKFDWRRLIQGHTLILIRSHTTLAQIFKLIFPPTIIPQFYFALVSPPPLFSSWNSFIKTFVAGQPLKVIAFWIQLFVWLYYLIKSLVLVSKQVVKMVSRRRDRVKSWFIDFILRLNLAAFQAGVMHS